MKDLEKDKCSKRRKGITALGVKGRNWNEEERKKGRRTTSL